MAEKITLTITDELQHAVKRLDDARDIFYSSRDEAFFDVPMREHINRFVAESQALFDAVPSQLVWAAHEFWYDPDEKLYDNDDYHAKCEEGASICALFVLMDMHGILKPGSFSSLNSSLDSLGDDLSDLRSYCPAYDIEYDIWNL